MRRNVVVLCLDSVRADTFAARARRLADRADVTLTGCRAAGGWTVASHASLLTGRPPHAHGAHALAPRYDALDRRETLAGDLDGYSLGVSAAPDAGSAAGLDALFDEFHDVRRSRPFHRGADVAEAVDGVDGRLSRARAAVRGALAGGAPLAGLGNALAVGADAALSGREPALLDDGARTVAGLLKRRLSAAERSEPAFAFATFAEAAPPLGDRRGLVRGPVPIGWTSDDAGVTPAAVMADPAGYAQEAAYYRRLYAENVAYLDRVCAGLADDLVRMTRRETTVVVTADHGVNLLDDDDDPLFGHGFDLSEAVTHVPLLLVNPPDGYPAVVDEPVSHLGVRDLIRGLAAGEAPDPTDGTVAAELVGPVPGTEAVVAADPDRWDRVRRCVYPHARTKLHWTDHGDRVKYELDPAEPCRQTRLPAAGGRAGAPRWAGAVFDESAAATYARTRREAADAAAVGANA